MALKSSFLYPFWVVLSVRACPGVAKLLNDLYYYVTLFKTVPGKLPSQKFCSGANDGQQ